MLLLIGQFSIQHNQAQEPMANDSDKEILTEKAKYFILNHIHFSDDVEEEQSDADEESGHNSENVTQSVNQGQCVSKNRLHLFQDIILKRLDNFTSLDESDQEERESEPSPSKLEYQRPVCKKGEGCDIPLDCYNFVTNGPHDIVPDPPRTVELTPLQLQSLLANGTYKNCCVLVMFYAPWCEYSVNFAQKFNAIGRTFLNLPVVSIDLSAHDP